MFDPKDIYKSFKIIEQRVRMGDVVRMTGVLFAPQNAKNLPIIQEIFGAGFSYTSASLGRDFHIMNPGYRFKNEADELGYHSLGKSSTSFEFSIDAYNDYCTDMIRLGGEPVLSDRVTLRIFDTIPDVPSPVLFASFAEINISYLLEKKIFRSHDNLFDEIRRFHIERPNLTCKDLKEMFQLIELLGEFNILGRRISEAAAREIFKFSRRMLGAS